jgi:hypothetical protein
MTVGGSTDQHVPAMFSKKRLPAIEVERSWSAKHAHHMLRIAEDTEGRIWLRHEDLRQWVPGLAAADLLSQRHPGLVRRIEPASDPYIEATAFAWVTKKSTSTATLKLLAWLESSILAPARRRHEWHAYSTRWLTRLHADGGQCSSVMADAVPR